jgi:L-threonylcarbamoyladenylate synthase
MSDANIIGIDVQKAARLLSEGKVIAMPTETVYGLAANAFSKGAIARIYEIKQRPRFNPLIIHSNTIRRFSQWIPNIPEEVFQLARVFSPGPITYVVPSNKRIPDIVTAGTGAVAIRVPQHPLAMALLAAVDFPVAAPSANPSGYVSPTTARHVFEQLSKQVPYILDGGECQVGLESTIVSFLDKTPRILRYGAISKEQLEHVLQNPVEDVVSNPNPVAVAPGMLLKHYATKHQLIVGDVNELLKLHSGKRVGIISFIEKYPNHKSGPVFCLSPDGNLAKAATRLFAAMRELDKTNVDLILAENFPDESIGKAINDRLKRASEK